MRRRSDRGKTKQSEQPKEEPHEKSKKSHRHSRRRKKSSSSSEGPSETKEALENIPQPAEVEVKDIELPQGTHVQSENPSDKSAKSPEEPKEEWKEDNKFWESEGTKTTGTQEPLEDGAKEKEESSLWKVQSANGAGGEIQKLKICRQRPAESPEIMDSSLRKRLRANKDGRSTDDSAQEESEKDTKKSKHKSRSTAMNSPTVVCDLSEDSPTKIKIINVGNINSESKGGNISKADSESDTKFVAEQLKTSDIQEDSQMSDTLDIALPADEPPPPKHKEHIANQESDKLVPNKNIPNSESPVRDISENPAKTTSELDSKQFSPKKSTSPSPSSKNETLKSHSSRTSSDSEATEDDAESHKGKKKRGREVLSTVKLKKSSPVSPKRESPDSEDVGKKNEACQEESTEVQENEDIINNKENEVESSPPHKENKPEETNGEQVVNRCPMPRKRRWGSSWSNRSDKKQAITISTDSLKMLIPDAKPVPAEELQLSVEEEEGQLDDDEEDEVVALVVKEEERQLERERQKEERQKEKEKQLEDKKRRQERFEKSKSEQPSPEENKVEIPRKIHLLTDDAKKLARLPSPPRRKPTSVLYITHLVRPFTVQQLKNLLLRTGTIAENGFWIDKIKSKCYVEYTTEDAAVETRHALHGVRWPTSNPKTLNVEFSTHDDLVIAQTLSEEPEVPRKAEPLTMVEGWVADQARIKEKTRRTVVREWDVGKPEHPDEILEQELKMKEKKELERKARKERPHRSATPEGEPPGRKARRKEEDAPAKLLDDLFRKTKTSPCIYWLPLTQEQISVKEEMRRQHMAEHERRMSELKKAELVRRDRERRSRK